MQIADPSGSFLEGLECCRCRREFPADQIQTVCLFCGGTLFAQYDLEKAKSVISRNTFTHRLPSLWRYRELLPVKDQSNIVTLGEGYTPILKSEKIARSYELAWLFVKDDGIIPTGSFKARGQTTAISKAKELGIKKVALASAGNAGVAAAAYCARASIECNVFMPKDTPESPRKQCVEFGATTHLVDGLISDCAKIVANGKEEHGWFDLSTLKEPYRVEGKKTMGYEIAEQLNWFLPDVIIYPTGGGTGLIGMWKAFNDLETLGWLSRQTKPKMISVQASGCAPIVEAFETGKTSVEEPFKNANTMASGLRVPFPYASEQILKVIRESNGLALSVHDEDIRFAMRDFSRSEGIFVCPEGAATLAALKKLMSRNLVDKDEKILLYNTGSGFNYLDLIANEA